MELDKVSLMVGMTDQSVDSRTAFVASHFSKRIKCGSENIKETKKTEGLRHNGDAYGYTVKNIITPLLKEGRNYILNTSANIKLSLRPLWAEA